MNSFEEKMRKELVRFIVGRQMFCSISREVLDMDTCVVILDSDGDPYAVFSQSGWQTILDNTAPGANPLAVGYTVDEETVK